jgi:UDP-N-acetyl-D-glucosamine dehydrogenase
MPSVDSTSKTYEILKDRIRTGSARVGVIGLGYVGLPLCHALVSAGLTVEGFDIDPAKISALSEGRCYLKHFGQPRTQELVGSGRFGASADFAGLANCDAIIVCVPTPLGPHQEPDLSFVVNSAIQIGKTLRQGHLVVLESTTYPGTTRNEFVAGLFKGYSGKKNLVLGQDVFVAFSPEREDPGRQSHSTRTIPKLVGGLDAKSTELAAMVYRYGVKDVIEVSSAEVAESAKLLENIFRAVNIALVNEMKVILDAMGTDIWEVVEAASTKPFGFMTFYPGPGLGGHCIPIDPFYLSWKAKEVGHTTRFIELAGAINTSMPKYVVQKTAMALNEAGKATKGANVLVLGLAYKPDIDDTRESPSFEIIEELLHLGAHVDYSDPFVPEARPVRRHNLPLKSIPLSPENVAAYDAVIIATDHSRVDYELVGKHAKIVVDTRNVMRRKGIAPKGTLVKA